MPHPYIICLWFGSLLLAVATSALAVILFDRLVRIQYAECHSEWEQQGCPVGYYWFPRESEYSSGTHARDVLFGEWMRTVPDWISVSKRATKAYNHFRIARRIAIAMRYIFVAVFVGLAIWAVIAQRTLGGSK